jgi:arylsulfatase A-like enzyme
MTKTTTRLIALFAWIALSSPALGATPPNIVYIMSDDQGWNDVGYRESEIATPHIDALAREGVRLEQFYSQPMCTPSRAALLTGRYPHRYGLQTIAIPSGGTYGLDTDERLLPEALRESGYRTAIVGKWHLGHADRRYWPNARGFDSQYGAMLGEIDYFSHQAHGFVDWFRDGEQLDEPGYVTELIGREAVSVIQRHDTAKPLFLYVAFTAPHAPYQAPTEYERRYAHIEDPARRTYAAMITAMDQQIGGVVAALEERGLRDRTLIVFQSDNGGPRDAAVTGEVDTSGGTIPPDNGPLRDGKGSYYEGGTRVPALANWPGHITAGSVVDSPIHMVDMYPTLAKLAGAPIAADVALDGMDVWPSIAQGAPSPRTEIVYGIEPHRAAVRRGQWKLVWHALLPSRVELFDLAADPGETRNLAADHPERVAELQALIEREAQQAAEPLIFTQGMAELRKVLFTRVAAPSDLAAPAH